MLVIMRPFLQLKNILIIKSIQPLISTFDHASSQILIC